MRVLYLNPFSQQVSGPDESLLTLLGRLVPMGVEGQVVLPKPGPQVPRYEKLGVKVHFAPLSVLRRRMGLAGLALSVPRLVRGAASVAAIAKRERIEIIHTNMEVVLDGAFASRLLRLPHVLHYRGNTLDRPKIVFDALAWLWSHTAERVLCISGATADIFRRRLRDVKVEVLYNPVDLTAFVPATPPFDVRREMGAQEGDLLVGTLGRVNPRKDLETFIKAGAIVATQDSRVRLVVVGAAESTDELEYLARLGRLANELGLGERLIFAGPRSDVASVLRAFDVFVLCSRHEGFGRVVAESMAVGRPVVVSREGAFPELVHHGVEGFLATSAEPGEFAAKMGQLLASKALREEMGRRGAERARAFSADDVAAHVWETYRDLVGRSRLSPGIARVTPPTDSRRSHLRE